MNSVLLDTSFIIRLLKLDDPLHENAKGYYRYFLENDIVMYISTISIAEYCVRGDILDIPFKDLRILPFNYNHAHKAGLFARELFKNRAELKYGQRDIIPNDAQLFAQADETKDIDAFVTSDIESKKKIEHLQANCVASFEHWGIDIDHKRRFSSLF